MCHCHKTFLRQGFQRTGIIRTFTSSYLQEIGKVFRGNEKKKKGNRNMHNFPPPKESSCYGEYKKLRKTDVDIETITLLKRHFNNSPSSKDNLKIME